MLLVVYVDPAGYKQQQLNHVLEVTRLTEVLLRCGPQCVLHVWQWWFHASNYFKRALVG